MQDTLRLGDRLIIEPASFAWIRPGDVIAFSGPDCEKGAVVWTHRVIAITPCGLLTRGDNAPYVDVAPVTKRNLLGKITHFERDGITRPVRGGRSGLLHARFLHACIHIRNFLIHIGRGPYGALRRSGLVAQWWHPRITQLRVLSENGALIQYICGRRVVARWWQQQNRFECDKPYDLVIPRPDEK